MLRITAFCVLVCLLAPVALAADSDIASLKKVAEQGDAEAQNNLGFSYEFGQGVPQEYVEAYAWYNLAAATHDFARKSRSTMEANMTPDQIAKGQARSKALHDQIEAQKAR